MHTGGCHCGKVKYEVDLDLAKPVLECNCSHCAMRGALLAFVPADKFIQTIGESAVADYRFNKHVIGHFFCTGCGIEAFGKGDGPDGPTVAINVRTIDNGDLDTLTRQPFDGKNL